ncbi:MAG TPA: hypothetical protein VHC91_05750 [Trinickia sp.]|uniref:hypothetical protein n=1 Tax=Trinickia sp. TaxID=2571163 RepID=UPI002CA290F1|nr:hypothetical protein [Trinickia sp.]HVW49896.1 hypothetical protein [Trinickia sp.]
MKNTIIKKIFIMFLIRCFLFYSMSANALTTGPSPWPGYVANEINGAIAEHALDEGIALNDPRVVNTQQWIKSEIGAQFGETTVKAVASGGLVRSALSGVGIAEGVGFSLGALAVVITQGIELYGTFKLISLAIDGLVSLANSSGNLFWQTFNSSAVSLTPNVPIQTGNPAYHNGSCWSGVYNDVILCPDGIIAKNNPTLFQQLNNHTSYIEGCTIETGGVVGDCLINGGLIQDVFRIDTFQYNTDSGTYGNPYFQSNCTYNTGTTLFILDPLSANNGVNSLGITGVNYQNGCQVQYLQPMNSPQFTTQVNIPNINPNILPTDLQEAPMDPNQVAQIADDMFKQASQEVGYDGLPYDVNKPITATDATNAQKDFGLAWPRNEDFLDPMTDSSAFPTSGMTSPLASSDPGSSANPQNTALGNPDSGASPSNPASGTDPASSPSTSNPASTTIATCGLPGQPKCEIDWGSDVPPAPSAPSEQTPTGDQIIQPLINLYYSLINGIQVPAHPSECPKATFNFLNNSYTISSHCDLLEELRGTVQSIMPFFYYGTAFIIVLAA